MIAPMLLRNAPWRITALLLSFGVFVSTARAEVSEVSVGRLGGLSDVILIGRVVRTTRVPVKSAPESDLRFTEATLASVEPLQWIKGDPRPGLLWVWAEAIWMDDISRAVEGERCLFFLQASGVADLVEPESLGPLAEATSGQPIHRTAHSGHGRMVLSTVAGEDYATLRTSTIVLPSWLDTIPGPVPGPWRTTRSVRVADLVAYVRARVVDVPKASDVDGLDVEGRLRALDGDWTLFGEALDSFWSIDDEALGELRRILRDPASPLREAAALALRRVRDPGLKLILEDLHSEDVVVRRGAAFAAEQIGIRELRIGEDDPRESFAFALVDSDAEVRWRMLRCFADEHEEFEGPLVRAVVRGLRDASPNVRWHAARCVLQLFRYHEAPLPELQRGLVERPLLLLARAESLKLRRAAWEALGVSATRASQDAAQAALSDPDPVVRVKAAGALALVDTPEATHRLVELLRSTDLWMRRTAAFALGMARAVAAVEPLVAALGDGDEYVRRLVAIALGRIGPKAAKAVPALESLLDSERDHGVEFAVRDALQQIKKT